MADSYLDLITDAELTEEAGQLVAAVRSAIVKVNKDAAGGVFYAALNDSAVPQPGAALNAQNPDLKVETRDCSIAATEGNIAKVRIVITYRLQRSTAAYVLRVGTSLGQITRSTDKDGAPITVSHEGETQGAEITVLEPEMVLGFAKTYQTNTPRTIAKSWIGKVNSDTWQGGEPGTWICTRFEGVSVNEASSTRSYNFDVEFSYNPRGHQPAVVFKLEDGTTPPDPIEGESLKTINHYESRPYAPDFPSDS